MTREDLVRVITATIAVFVAFLLSRAVTWWERRRRLTAHWAALAVERDLCVDQLRIYLRDDVAAPLYRLPTVAFSSSLAALLAEGAVRAEELKALTSFAGMVDQVNRGLERAAAVAPATLGEEVSRLRGKVNDVLSAHGDQKQYEAYAERASRVLEKHLR